MVATDEVVRCSFCEKTADEVDQMVTRSTKPKEVATNRYEVSIRAAICDECLALCTDVLEEAKRPPASTN